MQKKTANTFRQLQISLGQFVRQFRADRHLSIRDLERTSGIRKSTLSRIEHAKANPCVSTLDDLATAFGLNLAEFIRIVEEHAEEERNHAARTRTRVTRAKLLTPKSKLP